MSTPPLAVALIPDGTNTDAAERGNRGVGSRYVRERENAAPAFLPSGKGRGGVAPVSRNGPRRFCRLSSPIRHYFPDCWAVNWSAAGTAHGNLTPPRISPSCPHCVILQPDGFQMLWTTLILSRAVAGQEYHYAPFRSWPRRVLPGFYRLPLLAHTGQDCMQDQL